MRNRSIFPFGYKDRDRPILVAKTALAVEKGNLTTQDLTDHNIYQPNVRHDNRIYQGTLLTVYMIRWSLGGREDGGEALQK